MRIDCNVAQFILGYNDTDAWVQAALLYTNNEHKLAYTLDQFLIYLVSHKISPVYMQDLNLEGTFIIHWCIQQGIPAIPHQTLMDAFKLLKDDETNELHMGDYYDVIRDDKGTLYMIQIRYHGHTVTIKNSRCKLLNDVQKFGFNVKSDRALQLTREYNEKDIQSVSEYLEALHKVLKGYLKEGRQITIGSDALRDLKRNTEDFDILFNVYLDEQCYKDILQGYRGGICYTDKDCINKELGKGYILDINSIYTFVQEHFPLPVGSARKIGTDNVLDDKWFVGVYSVKADVSKDGIPCISAWNSRTECLETEATHLDGIYTLSKFDYDLLIHNYDMDELPKLQYGYEFDTRIGLFHKYFDKWYSKKAKAKTKAERDTAKAYNTNEYGKFGAQSRRDYVHIVEDGVIKWTARQEEFYVVTKNNGEEVIVHSYDVNVKDMIYIGIEEELKDKKVVKKYKYIESKPKFSYVPLAQAITSMARWLIVNYAMQCKKYGYVCAIDTDAIHIICDTLPDCLEYSDTKLGAFDIEASFDSIKHLGIKQYGYKRNKEDKNYDAHFDKNTIFKLSGVEEQFKSNIPWDEFKKGYQMNKLRTVTKALRGGSIRVVLGGSI